MSKKMDVLAEMGETTRWRPSNEVELVWNDKVLVVVDQVSKRVVVMVINWMTELEVTVRDAYGEYIGGEDKCHS